MDSKNIKKRVYGVGERIGVGGWWDMDSKNIKKRVYGVGERIGVEGWWETRQQTQIEERVLGRWDS